MESQTPVRLHAARTERTRIRRFFAGLLVVVAVLDIFEAMFAHHPLRDRALEGLVPTGVSLGGRTATVVAGLALLLLARGIARGKRVAWQLTVLVLAASALVHLLKNLDFEEAVLALWVLLGLWWLRAHFQASSDPAALRRGLVTIGAAIALALVYVFAGSWLLVHSFGGFELAQPPPGARLTYRARWFLDSIPIVAGALLLIGLLQLLRPVAGASAWTEDRERSRSAVRRWGHNPVAWLSLQDGIHRFWADSQAYVAYRVSRRVAVALGDPVAPPRRVSAVAAAFHEFCDRHDWVSSFYEVERPEVYRRLGYRLVPIGSDAVVLLATFTLAGRQSAHLRRALHRSEREGVTFSFLPGPQAWDLEAEQLRNVSASWLRRGRGPEMSFSVGTLETLQEPEVTVGLAHGQDGRLLAFVSWLPIPGRDGWCLDLMRRRPDATWGVMEALITKSLEEAKRRGLAEASLGLAPLALVGLAGSRRLGALRLLYGRLDRFRGSRSLRAFKAKFSPRWEPRYLAVPDAALLPEVLAALLGVHLPRPLRLLTGFRTPRRAGPAERRVPAA